MSKFAGWEDFDPKAALAKLGHASASVARPKVRKYRNAPTFVLSNLRLCEADAGPLPLGASLFASRKEAERFVELVLEQRDGKISGLTVQPRYALHVLGANHVMHVIGEYRSDFAYVRGGRVVVEDVKSPASKTPIYEWKVKHLRAEYGIEVVEI